MKDCRILIVGGGIGGLTAALSLQHFGFKVLVFEQAPVLREFGAGVVITPNATHALNFLNVGKQVIDLGSHPRVNFVRHYKTGEKLEQRPDASFYKEKYGADYFQAHRADLQNALSQAVLAHDPDCLRLEHVFLGLVQDEGGVTAHFKNGSSFRGEVLIGCDGSASAVRASVFSDEPVAYTGQVAFRALIPMAQLSDEFTGEPRKLYVGPGRMFLQYPIRRDTIMNVIGIAQQPNWEKEGWSIPAEVSEFLDLYRDFHSPVGNLIAAIPPGQLFKWGLRDREPLANWVHGRVAMLGDAAHPMTPFLGQGAVMAIEDGLILGRCFKEAATIDEALSRYEGARKMRANGVQLASREQAKALQGQVEAGIERFGPGKSADRRGLLDYNPVLVPI